MRLSEFLAMDNTGTPRMVVEAVNILVAHDIALRLRIPHVMPVTEAMREWRGNYAKVQAFRRTGLSQAEAEEAASTDPDAAVLLLDTLPRVRQLL